MPAPYFLLLSLPAMSNDSGLLHVWEASNWADTSQCPPSVGGATFLIVAYSAVIAIGLLGNAGLVFIIARQQELRNVTNILIANLSCSDILMCIVCLPVTVIYTLMDRWVLGEALCKVSAPRTLTAASWDNSTHQCSIITFSFKDNKETPVRSCLQGCVVSLSTASHRVCSSFLLESAAGASEGAAPLQAALKDLNA